MAHEAAALTAGRQAPRSLDFGTVDSLLSDVKELDPVIVLLQARAIWKDRDDLPDFRALRREFDRAG
jgi:hypothetical protein